MIKVVLAALLLALVAAAPAEAGSKKNPWDIGNLYKESVSKPQKPRIQPVQESQIGPSSGVSGSSYTARKSNPPSDSSYSQPSKRRRDGSSY